MKLFDRDPGGENKTGSGRTGGYNQVTMPSRNYAILTETDTETEAGAGAQEGRVNGYGSASAPELEPPDPAADTTTPKRRTDKNAGHAPLHAGESGAGTTHPAADGRGAGGGKGGLSVCYRVEIDQHDARGGTEGYGLSSESPFSFLVRYWGGGLLIGVGVVPMLGGEEPG